MALLLSNSPHWLKKLSNLSFQIEAILVQNFEYDDVLKSKENITPFHFLTELKIN